MTGRCHCGAVEFRVPEVPDVAVRCNFGSGTTEHFFCGECGVHTHFYTVYTDPPRYGYSLTCIDEVDVFSLEVRRIDMKSI